MKPFARGVSTLLFDWDGTLADSATQGFAAFEKTFCDLGVPFCREDYDALYSPNWYTMYETLGLARERWQTADDLWLRHYGEEPALLVAGARETVIELSRKGYRLGVVSSGTDCRVSRELEETGIKAHFRAVVCNEHITNKKPHPEGLEMAMRALGSPRGACCYVGDSPEDILMGRSANVLTVGVRSAYPSSKRLADAGPDIFLEEIKDLLEHF